MRANVAYGILALPWMAAAAPTRGGNDVQARDVRAAGADMIHHARRDDQNNDNSDPGNAPVVEPVVGETQPVQEQEDQEGQQQSENNTDQPLNTPSCEKMEDCPGVMCAGGGGSVACVENQCRCQAPEAVELETCSADSDCNNMPCDSPGFIRHCYGGKCLCSSPEELEGKLKDGKWNGMTGDTFLEMSKSKLCGKGKNSYTTDTWKELQMDDWMNKRAQDYPQKVSGVKEFEGQPALFAAYNADGNRDDLFFFPAKCKSLENNCQLESRDFMDKCETTPQRSLAVWAFANWSSYMQQLARLFKESQFVSSLKIGDIASTFKAQDEDLALGDAAWHCIIGGFLTSLGSITPVGANGINFAAGIFTMASGIASTSSETIDERFSSFAKLSSGFGDAITEFNKGFATWFDRMMAKMPLDGGPRSVTFLPDMMRDGVFASENVILKKNDVDFDAAAKGMQAALINTLWREQDAFIVQMPKGKMNNIKKESGEYTFNYDPCFEGMGKTPDSKIADYLEKTTFCDFDNEMNWFIFGWGDRFGQYMGTGKDDLAKYDLDRGLIIDRSRKAQDQMKGFAALDKNAMAEYWANMKPGEVKTTRDMVRFNLPVCDLTNIDLDTSMCWDLATWVNNGKLNWDRCFKHMIHEGCKEFNSYGNAWPFEYSI